MADVRVVQLLTFDECPNAPAARDLIANVIEGMSPGWRIEEIDATEPEVAAAFRFPGSPTIRIGGRDVDPTYLDGGDYTPRCRLYRTAGGLRGLPERSWIEMAITAAAGHAAL